MQTCAEFINGAATAKERCGCYLRRGAADERGPVPRGPGFARMEKRQANAEPRLPIRRR
jgi:hypothetical protein